MPDNLQPYELLQIVAHQAPVHEILHVKNTVVGSCVFLQGIFMIHGLTCISFISCTSRWALYHLCHLGSPKLTKYRLTGEKKQINLYPQRSHRSGTHELTKAGCLYVIFRQIIICEDLIKVLVLRVVD